MSNVLRRFCAVILGLVFTASAILKLIDPVGTGLIVSEYFSFLHIAFLKPAALVTGEILSLLEAAVGLALITGAWSRITAVCTSVMVVFFLIISLLLVMFNPSMDCGCFGQAIHLTHSQTLWKNIFLLVLAILAFVPFRYMGEVSLHRYVAFAVGEALVILLAVCNLVFMPLIDFTEFKPSATIINTGSSDFISDYPILPVWNDYNPDCSDEILNGPVLVVSVYAPEKLSDKRIVQITRIVQEAYNAGMIPVVLSCGPLDIPGVETYYSDYKKLLTLNRSNGGLVYLNDGSIVEKRSNKNYFSQKELEELCTTDSVDSFIASSTGRSLFLQVYVLILLCAVLFI